MPKNTRKNVEPEIPRTTDYMNVALVPTPETLARLTAAQREERVIALIAYSHRILDEQLHTIEATHKIAGIGIMFSGGNDSTTLAHLFKDRADFAVHANTTIGIEETRNYVRKTCADWGLMLREKSAPTTYRELVLDQGFPGPGHHYKMYQRLKERCLEAVRTDVVGNRGRKERVVFIAGRRREESDRRKNIPLVDRKGAMVFVSPIVTWTKLDMNTYRLMHAGTADPVPVNTVSDLIHMSGECLCGAYAKPGELDEIGLWFPAMKAEINALEDEVRAAGHKRCTWGHGGGRKKAATAKVGIGCEACENTDGGTVLDGAGTAVLAD